MNFVKSLTGSNNHNQNQNQAENPLHTQSQGSQGNGGLMGRFNNAAGGGQSGEAKEDKLDKAVDYVQEHVFGQGPQNNESAIEQHKDEMISDSIRKQYKNVTGKEFFVKDK